MNLITEFYPAQNARWPQEGRHILAQYEYVRTQNYTQLVTPREMVYPIKNEQIAVAIVS